MRNQETYYYRAINDSAGGQVVFPPSGDLPAVLTATRVSVVAASGDHLANSVLHDKLFGPDATTPAVGTLLLVEALGISRHPVSGFVGEGGAVSSDALVDLNNLYAEATGETLGLDPGVTLGLTTYRGLDCPGLADHTLFRLRRAPASSGTPAITEALTPGDCFAPGGLAVDFDCDGAIDSSDSDAFGGQFGRQTSVAEPSCTFHPDFDKTGDLRVGVGDFNLLLSVFGELE